MKTIKSLIFVFVFSIQIVAQNNQTNNPPVQPPNPIDQISADLTKVAKSLQVFNKNFKAFLEILPQGIKFSEKQQNFLLAFEILNRAEQRVQILQKFQIELTEKQASVKTRLTQIEQDVSPEGIDRSVALLGTTRTAEIRDSRRKTLEGERNSLQQLVAQINQTLAETSNELREALSLVKRLRDKCLPQIEEALSDLK